MGDFQVITPDFINLQISTSKNDISFSEKRFPKDLTVSALKEKLELMTGGSCNTMQVDVYSENNQLVCTLNDNDALLGSFPIDDGMRLHVVDQFLIRQDFEMANEPKFELSEEDYTKRSDSVKAFLLKNKMGKYNEENLKKKQQQEEEEKNLAESMKVGSRCTVNVTNAPSRLGTIMYIGDIDGLPGYWIGVKYDEPLGKNDGSVKGKRYFECPDKYGAFVKPQNVICGEFPEEDYDLNEEI